MNQKIIDLIYLTRPHNALMAAFSCLVGFGFAGQQNLSYIDIACSVIILLSCYATIQNDIEDYDVDKLNKRNTPLINGTLDLAWVKMMNSSILIAAILIALSTRSTYLIIFSVFAVLLSIAYNKKPLMLSRRPISSIAILPIISAGIPTVIGLGEQAWTMIGLIVLSQAILRRASLALLKDYKDFDGDKKAGKNTFLIKYGPKITRMISIALGILGHVLLLVAICIALPSKLAIILAAAVSALAIYRRLKLNDKSNKHNNKIFSDLYNIENLFDLGLAVCLFIF